MTNAALATRSGRAGTNPTLSPTGFKYMLVAPAVFILLLVGLFPFVYSIIVSFQKRNMWGDDLSWQGFDNYARAFGDDRLWESLAHTGIITGIALPLQLIFGLWMAHHFLEDRRGKRLFIALLIIPTVISPIVAGSMWRLMFDQRFGPINQMISWIAGDEVTILWTIQTYWAYPAIIICEVWEWTPFMFIILLAALSNVDPEQTDAASIDGASRWQSFRFVVLPAIWPVMVIALLIRGLDLVRVFDVVWQVTRGGPGTATETMSIYMYIRGFQEGDTSFVGAQVVIVIILLTALVIWALKKTEIAR